MESTTTRAEQGSNSWEYVIGIKAYRRAVRKDHSARNRNACPWCENTNTLPFEEEGYETGQDAPQRICTNCFYIFTEPADRPLAATHHEG